MAAAILEMLPKEGFVLRARGKETPFSGFSKGKPDFDKKLENVAPWVIHDLRRTFAKLAFKGGAKLDQIQLSLGHASIQTTERYLGVQQDLTDAPCDYLHLKVE